jgi:hypothetical protein
LAHAQPGGRRASGLIHRPESDRRGDARRPNRFSCVPAARSERADGPMTGNPDKSICLQVVNKLPGNTPRDEKCALR